MKGYLVLALLIVATVLGILYIGRDMFFEPFDKKYERKQVDALIAMARADTIGVKIDNRCTAQKAVVDVALRRQAELEKKDKQAQISFLQMLRNCVTLYPDGWIHSKVCFRSVWAIWGSARYKESPWDDTKKCVLDKLKAGIDSKACATKYTRGERRYEDLTDEEKAAEVLETTMDVDPRFTIEGIKFLCPRPKKSSFLQHLPPATRVAFFYSSFLLRNQIRITNFTK